MPRESMTFDVIIVGGGPAGLSASIRLAQLSRTSNTPLSICLIEKAANIGGQILSGAVLDPHALNELIPDWQEKSFPSHTPVVHDTFTYLTEHKAWHLPVPPPMKNHGNRIISLGQLCQWLATEAESLGVNLFPGFAAVDAIYDNDTVVGIITGDQGIDKTGHPKSQHQPGIELRAKQVLLAEGCRGSLSKKIIHKFNLNAHCDPQTYGLGIKELWEVPAELHHPGQVTHTIGWPLKQDTYGGSFVYHFGKNLVSIGFVVGLDYQNPYLNPYEEFQRFKTHPTIYPLLASGRRIAYGARTLIEGGIQSLPQLSFPGGMLIGDAAGFLNVPRIKGIHTAMKSGMIAAETLFADQARPLSNMDYQKHIEQSWLWDELYRARNIRPSLRYGLYFGLAYAAIDTYVFRGRAPWTLHHKQPDYATLRKATVSHKIDYPKHDNKVTFDIMSSVFLANISYEENQPNHLILSDPTKAISVNYNEYASPESRYCPAGVYEITRPNYNDVAPMNASHLSRGREPTGSPNFVINNANCLQCKACDIKDPTQNITWTPSEGGSGPQYNMM